MVRRKGLAGLLFRGIWLSLGIAIVAAAGVGLFASMQFALASQGPTKELERAKESARMKQSASSAVRQRTSIMPAVRPVQELPEEAEVEEEQQKEKKQDKPTAADLQQQHDQESSALKAPRQDNQEDQVPQMQPEESKPDRKDHKKKQSGAQPLFARSQRKPGKGARVAVVIPFRDREMHLIKFKEYWRWFANVSPSVQFWDIYVAEQFDLKPFNRGWCFNIGFAVAARQTLAAPEIKELPPHPSAKCAAIQDIDYLPEQGVDYADCSAPTQLSSEIDRFNWGVPYPQSAGGIVGMKPEHWKQINGFSNDYFGWGAEDDDLYQRLKLSKLLTGSGGWVIRRPSKGHGRFSGKFMHSMNHTKRITDNKAYANNLKLLAAIQRGSDRWKQDGLANLAFRMLDHSVDDQDFTAYGITYYHVRAKRGVKAHQLSRIPLAVPSCKSGLAWAVLGTPVPFNLESLRRRARAVANCPAQTASDTWPASFLLVNLTSNLAKVLDEQNPDLLMSFYRSLESPSKTGLVIADPRPRDAIKQSYAERQLLWAPIVMHNVCRNMRPNGGYTYKLYTDLECQKHKNAKGIVWEEVPGAVFAAHTVPLVGKELARFCYAGNKKREVQRFKKNGRCAGESQGLTWENEKTLYVGSVSGTNGKFCVGTWRDTDAPVSRIMPKSNCGFDGFKHEFSFNPLDPHTDQPHSLTALLCVSKHSNGNARLAVATFKDCKQEVGSELLGSFPVWTGTAAKGDVLYSVCDKAEDDMIIRHDIATCNVKGCCPHGWVLKLIFSLPRPLRAPELVGEYADQAKKRRPVCVGENMETGGHTVKFSDDCAGAGRKHIFNFQAPSLEDIVAGQLTLLQEGINCHTFICPETISRPKHIRDGSIPAGAPFVR